MFFLKIKILCTIFFHLMLTFSILSQQIVESFELSSTKQIIIVVANSINTDKGSLYRFERSERSTWNLISNPIPVIIGRKGFALGDGLISLDDAGMDKKVEGDKKSPAGVFTLTKAFGFIPGKELNELKIPYVQITDMTECVDDSESKFYNQIVRNNEVDTVDWNTSEKMRKSDPWYRFGVFVDNNCSPVKSGNGSCIFLHNWNGPDDTTVGCTAMSSEKMKEIVLWLDMKKMPILVQLTTKLYNRQKDEWGLPDLK